jgi:ribonuclease BN (tRNA processing enzyme)
MKVTMIGTANPCPQLERAGNSIAIEIGSDTVLVDCGPNATYRLLENDFNIVDITKYFFTHHHMDHNADFFHLALVSWYLGRDELTVYGPEGTNELIDGFLTAYEHHISDVSKWRHKSPDGLRDIDIIGVDEEFEQSNEEWEVSALPTEHAYTMDVYAYRFNELTTDKSVVYSADTTPLDSMVEFSSDTDILIHDCNITGELETPLSEDDAPDRYFQPPYSDYLGWVFNDDTQDELTQQLHSSASEAGEIAERAGVDTLVLTHFNPLRNPDDIKREAKSNFSGNVKVAKDGLSFTLE